MADDETDTNRFQAKVESILDDLVTIGNKAQSTEQVLKADPITNEPTLVSAMVADAVESVKSTYPSATIHVTVPETPAVRINPSVLQSVIEEILENAARHVDDVTITITYDTESRTLTVVDDGSGIPDHEITVLEDAQETDLKHGSGLGLWLIKWGTETFGGSVNFETDDSTKVRIEFPPSLVEDNSNRL